MQFEKMELENKMKIIKRNIKKLEIEYKQRIKNLKLYC